MENKIYLGGLPSRYIELSRDTNFLVKSMDILRLKIVDFTVEYELVLSYRSAFSLYAIVCTVQRLFNNHVFLDMEEYDIRTSVGNIHVYTKNAVPLLYIQLPRSCEFKCIFLEQDEVDSFVSIFECIYFNIR